MWNFKRSIVTSVQKTTKPGTRTFLSHSSRLQRFPVIIYTSPQVLTVHFDSDKKKPLGKSTEEKLHACEQFHFQISRTLLRENLLEKFRFLFSHFSMYLWTLEIRFQDVNFDIFKITRAVPVEKVKNKFSPPLFHRVKKEIKLWNEKKIDNLQYFIINTNGK